MTKIKICGLTRPADIEAVNECLPDYIGFVFAPGRRRITLACAASLKAGLRREIMSVGVFVNEEQSVIKEAWESGAINLIQLHGDEDEEYLQRLKQTVPLPIIKAAGVGSLLPPQVKGADFMLYDTSQPEASQRGGYGIRFNWNLLAGVTDPFFLAGGLNLGNVAAAIRVVHPYCADVSSGVETDGFKDPEKIQAIVEYIRRLS